jgi:broad specificity phosphatase PhoE
LRVIEFRRHGKWNFEEDKLTPEGQEEVEKLAETFREFNIIITGLNRRDVETGKIIAQRLKKPLEVGEGLEEITSMKRIEEKVKKVLEYILLERKEEKILIIAGGRLIGALYLHLLGKSYTKLEDLHLFDFLRGFRITISICN